MADQRLYYIECVFNTMLSEFCLFMSVKTVCLTPLLCHRGGVVPGKDVLFSDSSLGCREKPRMEQLTVMLLLLSVSKKK